MASLFLEEVSYRGSKHTYDNYALDIERRFLPYLDRLGVRGIEEITRAHCAGFISAEATRSVGRFSVRKSFDVMRRWLNWCVEGGYLEESPAAKLKPPRMPQSARHGYTREELALLMARAREAHGFLGQRDYALLLVMVGTGMRAEGILSLTTDQLNSSEYRAEHRISIVEKGRRERRVTIGRNAHRALQVYQAVRPQPKLPTNALWLTQRREPMEYSALAAMLSKLGEYAGVAPCIAHRFRHTFAVEHYRANKDIIALRIALGHSAIQTTEQYLRSLGAEFAEGVKRPSPDEWLV